MKDKFIRVFVMSQIWDFVFAIGKPFKHIALCQMYLIFDQPLTWWQVFGLDHLNGSVIAGFCAPKCAKGGEDE